VKDPETASAGVLDPPETEAMTEPFGVKQLELSILVTSFTTKLGNEVNNTGGSGPNVLIMSVLGVSIMIKSYESAGKPDPTLLKTKLEPTGISCGPKKFGLPPVAGKIT
jgi:hypothetical protein